MSSPINEIPRPLAGISLVVSILPVWGAQSELKVANALQAVAFWLGAGRGRHLLPKAASLAEEPCNALVES